MRHPAPAPGAPCPDEDDDAAVLHHHAGNGERIAFWRMRFAVFELRWWQLFQFTANHFRFRILLIPLACWRWLGFHEGFCWQHHRAVKLGAVKRADGLYRAGWYFAHCDHDGRLLRKECGNGDQGSFWLDAVDRNEVDEVWKTLSSCYDGAWTVEPEDFQNWLVLGKDQFADARRLGWCS